jgi:hypothetical protein
MGKPFLLSRGMFAGQKERGRLLKKAAQKLLLVCAGGAQAERLERAQNVFSFVGRRHRFSLRREWWIASALLSASNCHL